MKKFLIIFSFLIFCGCVNKIDHPNFAIEDSKIYDYFEFVSLNENDRQDGLKQIQAIFKNYTDDDTKVAYRVDWFDENGFLIKSIMSSWKVAIVEGKRDLVIESISPSLKAKTYKVKMQFPNNNDEMLNNIAVYEFSKN